MLDVKIRMKTHKLTLHFRNNDILFLRKDKYSKQACCTFKFHPEIKILLKLGCQQTTCITNKTRDTIKQTKNICLFIRICVLHTTLHHLIAPLDIIYKHFSSSYFMS
jgi:hypothetical protein